MSIYIEDTSQIINNLLSSTVNESVELRQLISGLETTINSKKSNLPKNFLQKTEDIAQLVLKLSQELNLEERLKITEKAESQIQNFKLEFQDLLVDMESLVNDLEFVIKKIKVQIAVRLAISKIQTQLDGHIDIFSLDKALQDILEKIDESIEYMSSNFLKKVKNIAQISVIFLNNLQKDQLIVEDKKAKTYISKSKNTARAILWEISQYESSKKCTWELVIKNQSYEELIKESQKRISLLGED